MNSECALYLSTIPLPLSDSKDDVDRLTKNWNYVSDKLKESNLVLDLVNVLSGLDSSFFTWSLNRFTGEYDVVINPILKKDFDENIFEMCSNILDIRLYQNELLEFVNANQNSYICQSLSEEIVNVLDDLQQCVTKFHDRHVQSFLGVEKFYNYLKPARQTLSLLSNVVTEYNSTSLLYDKSNVGVLIMDHLERSWRNEVGLKKELLQHLLNVCLESYFILIKDYIAYSSVNKNVTDFFIKYKDKKFTLDNYYNSTDTLQDQDYEEVYNYHDHHHHNQHLEKLFNKNNDIKYMLDKRYVPKAFKNVAAKVFATGIYLRLMNKNLEFELMFRNLDDLVSDLDKVYKHVSGQFFEYLKSECRIFDRIKEFFSYYLFYESDYTSDVIHQFSENFDLNEINKYLENKNNNNNKQEDEDDDTDNSKEKKLRSKFPDGFGRPYFSYDNMKSLADSLEYYKYYKNINYTNKDKENADKDIKEEEENKEQKNNRNNSRDNADENQMMYSNEVEDKDTNSVDSVDVDKNDDDEELYNYHNDNQLETLFNYNNLDYRNLVVCFDLDKASRLVFTDKIVYKYKLLFKLMFRLKYAEHWLNQVSIYHLKTSKMAIDPELVPKFNLQLFTVFRMLFFVRDVLEYFVVDVLTTNVSEFLSSNNEDFLSLCVKHEKLLDSLVNSMFLKDSELVSLLEKILLIVVKLSSELVKFFNNQDYSLYYYDFFNLESIDKLNRDLKGLDNLENFKILGNSEDYKNLNNLEDFKVLDKFEDLKDNLNQEEKLDWYEHIKNLDKLVGNGQDFNSSEFCNLPTNITKLEKETNHLNSLLSNTGYCKMVSLAKNEFEKNLNQFKTVLSKTEFLFKDTLSQ